MRTQLSKFHIIAIAAFAAVLAGCGNNHKPQPTTHKPQPTSLETFELRGKVKRLTVVNERQLSPESFKCDYSKAVDYRIELEHFCHLSGIDVPLGEELQAPEDFEYYGADEFTGEEGYSVDVFDFNEQGMIVCNHTYSAMPAADFSGDGYMGQTRYVYDDNNNVVLEESYSADGILENKNTYVFDSLGNPVQELWWTDGGNMTTRTDYHYDRNGNQTERKDYYNDTLRFTYKSLYDNKGNKKVYEAIAGNEETVMWRYEYAYDNKGRLTSENYCRQDGNPRRTVITYNSKGQKESKAFYPDGALYDYETYQYDKQGNECRVDYYHAPDLKNAVYTIFREYDKKGNMLMEEYKSQDYHTLETISYDQHGIAAKEYNQYYQPEDVESKTYTMYENGVEKEEYQHKRYFGDFDTEACHQTTCIKHIVYELDDHGNWTSRTEFVENLDDTETAVSRITRLLEYYE